MIANVTDEAVKSIAENLLAFERGPKPRYVVVDADELHRVLRSVFLKNGQLETRNLFRLSQSFSSETELGKVGRIVSRLSRAFGLLEPPSIVFEKLEKLLMRFPNVALAIDHNDRAPEESSPRHLP